MPTKKKPSYKKETKSKWMGCFLKANTPPCQGYYRPKNTCGKGKCVQLVMCLLVKQKETKCL